MCQSRSYNSVINGAVSIYTPPQPESCAYLLWFPRRRGSRRALRGGGDATQVAYLQEENEAFAYLPIFLRCDEMVEVNRMKPLPKSCSQYLNHLLRRTKQFEPRPQLVPVARFLAACKPHGENGRESILVSHPRPDPQPRGPQQVGATLWLSRSKCYFGYFWRDCKYLILTFFKNITQVVYSNLFSSKPTNQVRGTNIKQIFLFFF